MSTVAGIGTALPEHVTPPAEGIARLEKIFRRVRLAAEGAEVTRHTVLPMEDVVQGHTLTDAMALYREHAPRLAAIACRQALEEAAVEPGQIDMVISVSCTGYMVPSLDTHLVEELGLRADVIRLPITELGCSGGSAGLAHAHRHVTAFPMDRVLLVAVELCSLTFDPADKSLDNLIGSLVFGDGAGAVVVCGAAADRRSGVGAGLQVCAVGSRLVPDSRHLIGFTLSTRGLGIVLDRHLPRAIGAVLAEAVGSFRAKHGVPEPAFYAVHAGGPRIFDAVEEALGLEQGHLAISRGVFREVGNLSSASILHVLKAVPEVFGDGLAIAFGPGVTIEMAHVRAGGPHFSPD